MKVSFDRAHLVAGLCYGALGMGLGIYMAASHNHGQHVTHAHILLAGFLLSIVYALVHRLWLDNPGRWWSRLQFVSHHLGLAVMVSSLFALYGGLANPAKIEPILAVSSILVLLALLIMLVMVLRPGRPAAATVSGV